MKYTETLRYSGASKTWMAKILGSDPTYVWEREFLDADETAPSCSGRTGKLIYHLLPGIYESCDRGDRELFEVTAKGDALCVTPDQALEVLTKTTSLRPNLSAIHQKAMCDALHDAIQLGEPVTGKCGHWVKDGLDIFIGHDATLYIMVEWYVMESHDDDDLSCGGYHLPTRMGYTRCSVELRGNSLSELDAQLHD